MRPPELKRRLFAFLIDRLIIILIGLYPLWLAEVRIRLGPWHTNPVFPPFLLFTLPTVYLFYVLLLEGLWGGQTIGKKLFGLRVVKHGEPIGLRDSLKRNLLRIVDAFPAGLYLIGLYFIKKKGRRLGDLYAGTEVVSHRAPLLRTLRPSVSWLKPLLGLALACLILPVFFQSLLWTGSHSRNRPRLKGVVLPPLAENAYDRLVPVLKTAGFNAVRISWEWSELKLVRRLHEAGFHVLVGTGEGWAIRKTPEDARRMVVELGDLENLWWGIGNEDYLPDLSSPREHLEEVNSAFKESSRNPTFHAGHMILHAPDLLFLRHRGYGPMDFTDILGFNAYPPLEAASWIDLVEMWWRDTKTNPVYQAFLDAGMRIYFWTEGWLVEPLKTNTFGYAYLVHSYLQYGKLKGKPVIITEWGGGGLEFASGQWKILKNFPELAGTFFYSWSELDRNGDGNPDVLELYNFLARVNAE
jgi:uncharacterized RDD family membrane protein YckC